MSISGSNIRNASPNTTNLENLDGRIQEPKSQKDPKAIKGAQRTDQSATLDKTRDAVDRSGEADSVFRTTNELVEQSSISGQIDAAPIVPQGWSKGDGSIGQEQGWQHKPKAIGVGVGLGISLSSTLKS